MENNIIKLIRPGTVEESLQILNDKAPSIDGLIVMSRTASGQWYFQITDGMTIGSILYGQRLLEGQIAEIFEASLPEADEELEEEDEA